MTDDRFMHSLQAEPRPELARAVLDRVRAAAEADEPARGFRLAPALAAAAMVALVAALFLFPSVRASAQAFLDLFRVRNFVAVQFDPARMERVRGLAPENSLLVFDQQEKLKEPQLPSDVPSRAAAEASTGIPVLEPSYVVGGLPRQKLQTTEDGRVRFSARTERLQAVIAALGLDDVQVPPGLDGQWVDVHLYPIALQRWGDERRHVELLQSRSPEVTLPPGLDLARLGEVGLRILGLDAGEARRIAASIDWSSTLLVPVPANATSFREVSVRGQKGLLIQTTGIRDDGRRREGAMVLWTESDRVFAISGNVDSGGLMQMAESLR